jgi:tetratricopeptide (TPR) repeat protein
VEAARQRIAWTIIGQTKFDQGEFALAENAFALALSQTSAAQPEHADITERLAAAVYKQGEAKRQAGDEAGSANDFLRVAKLAPASKVVPTAQYDAAAALVNSKQWERAVAVLEAYRHDYPKSEYAADVTRKLAVGYAEIGKPGLAAAEFERIAANPAEEAAVTREALTRAADLYEQAGNSARSVALLEQLVAKYPAPLADAIEIRARLAEVARKSGNAERLRYWQGEIIRIDAAAGAERTDRTRFLAAGAKLALVTPNRDAFRAVRLTAPLKQSLAAKKRALEVALRGYQEVAAYNIAATTTAANYEMAELYRVLASDLMASERPKKLSREERETYDALLEEQAFPLEEQAIKLHELNSARTVDGIYDEPVRQSFRALAQLKPGRYGKIEQSFDGPGDGSASIVNIKLAIMAQRAGKPDEAETTLRQVLERDPANAVAWSELGIVLRQSGRFKEARDAYEHALAGDASYAPAHRNLAVLLDLYLNEPAAALPEMERYRELGGDDKPVNGWIAELRARTGVKAAPAAAPEPVSAPTAAELPAAEAVAPTESKP